MKVVPLVGISLHLCLMLPASSSTWHVNVSAPQPGDGGSWETAFLTIQEGIDAASDGDTVMVAPGTYAENIRFNGKNITLRGTDPLSTTVVERTIIDGSPAGGRGSVVTFDGTEDETCILSGLTIRNGKAEYGGGVCGGSHPDCTHATIQNNVITQNSACGAEKSGGGGVYACAGTIQRNTISHNYGATYGGGLYWCEGTIQDNIIFGNATNHKGGGLDECMGIIQNNWINGNSSVVSAGGLRRCHGTVRDNVITGNVTRQVGGGLHTCHGMIDSNLIAGNWAGTGGGGVQNCNGTVQNNTIIGNKCDWGGGGLHSCLGIIQGNVISYNAAGRRGGGLKDCHAQIQGNIVVANSSGDYGGGLSTCDGVIQNNMITGNTAKLGGGGLSFCDAIIENNTISGNSAGTIGGGLVFCPGTICNCIIWQNVATYGGDQLHDSSLPTYSSIEGWSEGGSNIGADPSFVSPGHRNDINNTPGDLQDDAWIEGDYHLSSFSPCIDAGKNEPWMLAAVDLDGNKRIFYGVRSPIVDMGAYEYRSFPFKIAELQTLPGSRTQLTWISRSGDTYTLWSCPDISAGLWKKEATIPSQGPLSTWTDPDNVSTRKFYRIEVE